jgi:hypothetical protein
MADHRVVELAVFDHIKRDRLGVALDRQVAAST